MGGEYIRIVETKQLDPFAQMIVYKIRSICFVKQFATKIKSPKWCDVLTGQTHLKVEY